MDSKTLQYTPLDEIVSVRFACSTHVNVPYSSSQVYDTLKASFASGKTKPIAFRKQQLSQVAYLVKDNADALAAALSADLGRAELESHL